MDTNRKTRIGRIAKGEKILVEMLSEDLQDLYHKQKDAIQDFRDAQAAAREDKTTDNLMKMQRLDAASDITRAQFWLAVREKYQIWDHSIGVRDGYALVSLPEEKNQMPKEIKGLLEKLMGEQDD